MVLNKNQILNLESIIYHKGNCYTLHCSNCIFSEKSDAHIIRRYGRPGASCKLNNNGLLGQEYIDYRISTCKKLIKQSLREQKINEILK